MSRMPLRNIEADSKYVGDGRGGRNKKKDGLGENGIEFRAGVGHSLLALHTSLRISSPWRAS